MKESIFFLALILISFTISVILRYRRLNMIAQKSNEKNENDPDYDFDEGVTFWESIKKTFMGYYWWSIPVIVVLLAIILKQEV